MQGDKGLVSFFYIRTSVSPAPFVEDGTFSPVCVFGIKYEVAAATCTHLWISCFAPLISISGFVPDYAIFVTIAL